MLQLQANRCLFSLIFQLQPIVQHFYTKTWTLLHLVTIRKERKILAGIYCVLFFPGRTPEQLIPSLKQFQLFNKLKTAVAKDLLHKIAPEKRPRERKNGSKAKASNAKAATNTPDDGEMLENRFAYLCNLEQRDSKDDDK